MTSFRPEAALRSLAMILAVVAVPLAMGGRHPVGQIMLTAAALTAAGAWTIDAWQRRDGTWNLGTVELLFVTALTIGLLQLLPLSGPLLAVLSPRLPQLLPCLDGGPGSLGHWNHLSLTPGETLAGIGILFAQGVLATTFVQRIRSARDVEPLLVTVAATTGLIALLGIVQYFAGNGRYLWFYEFAHNDAGGVVKGTFTNRNHFAGFLAVGFGAVVWWAVSMPGQSRRSRGRQDWSDGRPTRMPWRMSLGWLVAAAVAFAAVASLSRGGTLALAVAAIVAGVFLVRIRVSRSSVLVGLAATAALLAAALGIHGWDRLHARFDALIASASSGGGHDRSAVWQAAWRSMNEFPWLGAGVGSHADMAQRAMPAMDGVIFTHAENSYLNLGVEAGWLGLGVAVAALLVTLAAASVVALRGDTRERLVGTAILAGLAATTVHGLVDFVWYVPGYSTLIILLGTGALALAGPRTTWLPSIPLRSGWGLKVLTGLVAAGVLVGIGMRQVAATRAEIAWERAVKDGQRIDALARRPTRPPPGTADGMQAHVVELLTTLERRIEALEQCVAARPDHPRAWEELGVARMDHFGLSRHLAGTALGITDLRLAAAQAGFTSTTDLHAWLERATGPAYRDLEGAFAASRRAVTIAPCSGPAWCVLAQLAFPGGGDGWTSARFLSQALLVRPNDSLVLFEAANESALEGDMDRAVMFWRRSFAADSRQRQRIIAALLPQFSSTEACELLEPDLVGLRAIDAAWAAQEPPDDLVTVRTRRIDAVLAEVMSAPPPRASLLMLEVAELQRQLGADDAARESLRKAVHHDPGSFEARRRLAMAALAAEDWATARQALEWCLLRRPHSADLRTRMERLKRLRLGENPRSSGGDRSDYRN